MGERSRTDPGTLEDAGAETPGSVTESRTAESSDADDSAPRDGVSLTGPGIDQKTEREVRRRTATLQKAFLRTVEEAWHLGKALRTAKEQVRHGQWIPWLNEVGLATRTAQRCMSLHAQDPEMRRVAHFESITAAVHALPAAKASPTSGGSTSSDDPGREVQAASATAGSTSSGDAEDRGVSARPQTEVATQARGDDTPESAGDDLPRAVKHLVQVLSGTPPKTAAARLSELREVYKVFV